MVAFSALKPGDVLYDVKRQKMGNTTMSRTVVYEVRVIDVSVDLADPFKTYAMVSWNGNAPRKYRPCDFERLRRSKPKQF